jgi:hypothetical protein
MTGSLLTLTCDDEAGQVVIEDLPCGPAGEACVAPVDGVEMLFDNADGRLTRVLVDVAGSGERSVAGGSALFLIAGLLGTEVAAAVEEAHRFDGGAVPLRGHEGRMASLSRLARLDAAKATSPVAESLGWAVEAAQLAAGAGLMRRATAEVRRVASRVASVPSGGLPAALVVAVADTVQEIDPRLAERLRGHSALPRADRRASAQPDLSWSIAYARVAGERNRTGQPQSWLDPQLIPAGVFRHHLWPDAELTVQPTETGFLAGAELLGGADPAALGRCWVRLVDPARRRVIARASFRDAGGARAVAEIVHQGPFGGAWVEVVEDPERWVISAQLRYMRRAMRWADTALCAGRRPPGLSKAEWDRVAGRAWERCAKDWSAARDPDRAYLAAERAATFGVDIELVTPPSDWAKDLAGRFALNEAPFLAETF